MTVCGDPLLFLAHAVAVPRPSGAWGTEGSCCPSWLALMTNTNVNHGILVTVDRLVFIGWTPKTMIDALQSDCQ